jgi:hypothetical protein
VSAVHRIVHILTLEMKLPPFTILTPLLCLLLVTPGCRKKPGAVTNSELERAAAKFGVVETPAAPASPAGASPAQPTTLPPAQQMQQALEAYRGGKFEDAVARLQTLRSTPAMSAQQYMALNDAIAAVVADLNALAAKGDERAVLALKQYEKSRTQQR